MSFDPALSAQRDLVRLLVGDTDPTHEQLENATYDALLAEVRRHGASAAGSPYCAAALAGENLLARWRTSGEGVTEKTVSKLSIRRGGEESNEELFRTYLDSLRRKCTELSMSAPKVLKAW